MIIATPEKPKQRSLAWRRAVAVLAVGAATSLTSCAASPDLVPDAGDGGASSAATSTPVASDRAIDAAPAPPTASPAPSWPGAEATRISAAVESSLLSLVDSRDPVTSDRVRTAIEQGFSSAGVAPEEVEVSIDRTPTGLDVEAVHGAGLIGGTCILGEVREGAVAMAVLPVLASGLCFVGDQR